MHNDRDVSLTEWKALLVIGSRFDCPRIRQRAIDEVDAFEPSIDPVEQIELARKHSVPQWLLRAHEEICQRHEPVTPDEAERLGARTTALLGLARERSRPLSSMTWDGSLVFDKQSIKKIVGAVFNPVD
jgi:hypothetical protein